MDLGSEFGRISTFAKWPIDAEASALILAKQGLYYSGNGDRVICFACSVSLDCWKGSESPVERHRRASPGCRFVTNDTTSQLEVHAGHDNCTSNSHSGTLVTDSAANSKLQPESQYRPAQLSAESSLPKSVELATDSYSQPNERPKYPQYSTLISRIESFRVGTVAQGQTAEKLAEAGWFFVGPGDKVRCFQCGGNLRDWERGDDAWREHRRWYKDCPHLKNSPLEPRHQNLTTTDALTFRIDPREVKARMDTPKVKTILNMGYESSLVKQVIENQLTTTGDDFPSAEALLSAIFALDEPQSTTPSHAGHPTTPSAPSTVISSTTTDCDNTLSAESSSPKGTIECLEENQRLRDSRTCKVCKEAEVNTVFLPCGHLVCCDKCASSLTGCIVCRTSIRGTVKTFLS